MKFIDRLTVDSTRLREDGALVCDARVARTGIQLYNGYECDRPEMDVVRVYRRGDEVFSDQTLASFAHRPVTNDHPYEMVSADTWKNVAVGQTSGDVAAEGRYIRVPLMVSDGASIQDVQDGKRELSAGYTCDLKWEAGETEDGEAYDAIQTNIRANHVAIVDRGRAGSECRIGDNAQDGGTDRNSWGSSPITISKKDTGMPELKTVVLGDEAVEVSVSDVAKIDAWKAEQAQNAKDVQTAHNAAIADKDKELAQKDAEIDDLKGKVLDQEAIDALVRDRAKLVADAKSIAPDVKTDGMTDAEVRKAVVSDKRGAETVADKTEAYIDAAFDLLLESVGSEQTDSLRSAVSQSNPVIANDAPKAREDMMKEKANAWKQKGAA